MYAHPCHYCSKSYWSTEGWKKYTGSIHPGLPKVPEGAEDPSTFSPPADAPEIVEVKEEEEETLTRVIALNASKLNLEKEFVLVNDEEDTGRSGAAAPMDI